MIEKFVDENKFKEINDVKDIQLILKYIFEKFHEFCKDNNLVYNMFGGTMLGAVRHQDIIPWDDDVDVTMPRNDYNKLESLLENNKLLFLKTPNDKNYPYPYKKICLKDSVLIELPLKHKYNCSGAFIDVFPADGYPQNITKVERKLLRNRTYRRRKVLKYHYDSNKETKILYLLKCLGRIPFRFVNLHRNLQYEVNLLSSNKIEDCDDILLYGAAWGRKGKIEKEKYFDRCLYKFGDFQAYGIRDYDQHLTNLYGDYMKLPPIEKRVSKHDYKLFIDKKLWEEINNDYRLHNRSL